ncbi:MAG: hypothetical protein AB1861_10485 [Cyanobacteriota bacterium]
MDTKKRLSLIFESDANNKIGTLKIAPRNKDSNHLKRRQQQRAINDAMIKIALMYGRKHFNKGALIFTLHDRNLRQTPYSHFTDTLRGLRVVCLNGLPNPQILTAYWHEETKRRVRK